jgi:hypothetical protein
MRVVLSIYIVTAAITAWRYQDEYWFIVHGVGAVAGFIALCYSLYLAGLAGELEERLDGPLEDQARDYMEEEGL